MALSTINALRQEFLSAAPNDDVFNHIMDLSDDGIFKMALENQGNPNIVTILFNEIKKIHNSPCGITVSKVIVHYCDENSLGSVKALADVILNDCITITQIHIIEGKHGMRIQYPHDPFNSTNDEYKFLVSISNREVKKDIENAVIQAYYAK